MFGWMEIEENQGEGNRGGGGYGMFNMFDRTWPQ